MSAARGMVPNRRDLRTPTERRSRKQAATLFIRLKKPCMTCMQKGCLMTGRIQKGRSVFGTFGPTTIET